MLANDRAEMSETVFVSTLLNVKIENCYQKLKISALEMFRLKMILRLLQMSSFNGKMSALNEINQLISTISQQPKPEWLTPIVITVSNPY